MGAVAPLSYQTIDTWARLMDLHPLHPFEVEALIFIDAAMFVEKEEDKPGPKNKQKRPNRIGRTDVPWPTKKK